MTTPRKPCGTYAAARRHYDSGEEMCTPCREAYRTYQRSWRERRRQEDWRGYYRAPCGTYSAQKRHRKLGETCEVCGPIAEKGRPRLDRPHGTEAAYKRHQRAGEDPCAECVEGRNRARQRQAHYLALQGQAAS